MHRYLVEYHPVIGYRFIPGLKARHPHEGGGYLIRINNYGFRSDYDYVSAKRNGMRRILVFGDSFTFGDGVGVNQRFSNRLEQSLRGVEVYNFGLTGSGTDQQYLVYREIAANMEFDLCIIAVWVENIKRVMAHYRYSYNEAGETVCLAKPYFELLNGKLELRNVPAPRAFVYEEDLPETERPFIDTGGQASRLKTITIRLGISHLAQRIIRYQPYPEYDSLRSPAWKTMRAILNLWVGTAPAKFLLVPIPTYHYVEGLSNPAHYQSRFKELATATGCHLYDPLYDLRHYPVAERRSFRFRKDVHFTPEGHMALAKGLLPVVRDMLSMEGQR